MDDPQYYTAFEPAIHLDPATRGAEWEHHLHRAIAEQLESKGLSAKPGEPSSAVPVRHVRLTPNAEGITGSLLLIRTVSGIGLCVTTPAPPTEAELQRWQRVVDQAQASFGSPTETYEWSAVIDCMLPHHGAQELSEGGAIGPLSLEPLSMRRQYMTPTRSRTLNGQTLHWSFPVRISGTSDGYDWTAASLVAGDRLHSLLCLLAVAWGYPWVVVDGPTSKEYGTPEVSAWPWWQTPSEYDAADTGENLGRTHVELPAWGEVGWSSLASDSILRNSVSAYREGMLLQDEHPSFALVAFVAAIEGIGQKLRKPERCAECRQITEATSRFRQAATLVAEDDELGAVDEVAKLRGTTAHQGTLHGYESMIGAMPMVSWFQHDPSTVFERHVYTMRAIASRLLKRSLQGVELTSTDGEQ